MMSPHKKIFVRGKPSVVTAVKKRVFVMMSGGVDSSVAAFLLKKSNKYEVIGMFIKGYNIDGCQEKDSSDARRVAEFLNIPFYVVDLENDYKKSVVDYMVNGYKKGITPNPDVMCNKEIKFGIFLKKAVGLGADCVATGHYVRIATSDPLRLSFSEASKRQATSKKNSLADERKTMPYVPYPMSLYQAKDKNKDQSYFLWTLTQEQLKYCLFPIGDYLKSEVRVIAKKAGLPTAGKKDSQGICFLGQISIRDFLKQFLPIKKGDIINGNGEKVGKHEGSYFYTIGQRHGLNLGKKPEKVAGKKGSGETLPYYVSGKNLKKNIIIVAEGENNEALYKSEVKLGNINLINQQISENGQIFTRVRYRQPLFKAKLIKLGLKKFKLIFDKPVKFVAQGQSAVFYHKDGKMVGGGVIS